MTAAVFDYPSWRHHDW